ncbi:ABC transporter ATP-binding protein [Oligoflexaceae bacterium]|nr:ABC transporter ATP-binding protein [Oligoflexaceae bacterium]
MIEVENVSKNFGSVQALKNVSFTVERGQVVGFLGANGAGKTTTMDILCGCQGMDEGSVRVLGHDVLQSPILAKLNIGYLPDEPPLYNDMTTESYVAFAAKLYRLPSSQLESSVDRVLNKLQLQSVRKRIVGNLSKGFRQRVALAQALVHNPAVLVLDEPTEGLDPNQIAEIRQLIHELKGDHTIILSSHILSEVESTCDHLIIINEGEILEQGSKAEIEQRIKGDDSSKKYILKVSSSLEVALSSINETAGIEDVSDLGHGYVEFSSASDAVLDKLMSKMIESGVNVRELRPERNSLEEVFFKLTKGGRK